MNVKCPSCHTEYELDDARVGATGITLRCQSCNHLFKVAQHVHVQPVHVVPDEDGLWMVEKSDGQVIRFRELTTLQRWIVERRVTRTDQISRTGKTWKPLGEIAELDSFFQVVDAARAAERVSLAPVAASTLEPRAPRHPTLGSRDDDTLGTIDDRHGDLDDDDPLLAWERRRRMSRVGGGILSFALLVIAVVFVSEPTAFSLLLAEAKSFFNVESSAEVTPTVAVVVESKPPVPPETTAPAVDAAAAPPAHPALEVANEPEKSSSSDIEPESEAAETEADKTEAGPVDVNELLRQADRARLADKTARAIVLYRRVLHHDERQAKANLGLGWALLDAAKYKDAVKSFRTALDRDSSIVDAYMGLGEAHRALGHDDDAAVAYRTFLDKAPGHQEAPIATRALEALAP